ncbi:MULTISPECIES: pyruvate kinase [unclassified Sinorhizobium]|uniref:pyruvate kinase n=1 Tax=unclassified Sinorhizobium TaxID=2613772 RepID=UPI003525C1DD
MADFDNQLLKSGTVELLSEMRALRDEIVETAAPLFDQLVRRAELSDADRPTLENLCHYLALRHHDIRALQRKLMWRGLSSLGRLESRVLPTIDAVLAVLAAIDGRDAPHPAPTEAQFFRGERTLIEATNALFGPPQKHRRGRIMVTLPGEVATDPDFILDLARRGMDVARINCAHDSPEIWATMANHVRAAGKSVGRRLTILMDIAGPKIRTEAVLPEKKVKIEAGDRLRLIAEGTPRVTADVPFSAVVSIPEIVTRLSVGDRVRYDDGKLEGVVESLAPGEAIVCVSHTKTGGTKLKAEKGLNLPDTSLGLSPLTDKDRSDLATVIDCADMLGYSFVSRPEDIDLLEEVLAKRGAIERTFGLIAKIEQPEAVKNLPALIARARFHRRPFGVMIARGDLAAEIGFERVAEMQEEMLWICEAASVPTIWATQVLEDLVKDGLPSRGEMTDAAMAVRAECVMLNKGPAVAEAVTLLDHLMSRMDEHMHKKTPTLRALKSW